MTWWFKHNIWLYFFFWGGIIHFKTLEVSALCKNTKLSAAGWDCGYFLPYLCVRHLGHMLHQNLKKGNWWLRGTSLCLGLLSQGLSLYLGVLARLKEIILSGRHRSCYPGGHDFESSSLCEIPLPFLALVSEESAGWQRQNLPPAPPLPCSSFRHDQLLTEAVVRQLWPRLGVGAGRGRRMEGLMGRDKVTFWDILDRMHWGIDWSLENQGARWERCSCWPVQLHTSELSPSTPCWRSTG